MMADPIRGKGRWPARRDNALNGPENDTNAQQADQPKMSTNADNWNENLMKQWVETQRKYWDAWSAFAKTAGQGMPNAGQAAPANPFAAFNPFWANGAPANPFAAAFGQGFGQGFGQMPGGANPFASNPFASNPFTPNSLNGLFDSWWSTLKPQTNGELGTVLQRFFDMGKGFMSLADGMFHSSGQDQPDTAMQMWMSGMQAALHQWIAQVQNNLDVATPDLSGISGTTLSTWARFADSVAPWLNMSQHYLKDIADGHLPGGIEMPGIGAAQEQFCRALSMPGLGYTREQQERIQELARHLLEYHETLRVYKVAFGKTALASLDAVQKRMRALHEKGEKIESLRALYDMWVDASEEVYAEFAMSDEYQVVYADLVNALMRVRQDMNAMAEQQYRLMNIPTRSEIDTVQHRQQELRRENRLLRRELEQLRASLNKTSRSGGSAARSKPATSAATPSPAEPEDDLTAIKGIGPKMMQKLYEQGIRNFARLAELNTQLAEQLDETLQTQGRILRDDWIGQARKLRD
jgi:class III poly(R)-hydroxyalkanoic acid synthase PhaE subunit